MNKENKKSYLPSPQFRARVILLLIILAIVSVSISIYDYFKNRKSTKSKGLPTHTIRVSEDITVSDIISKDTNLNGIPDWEESLWGLNPTVDGQKNKEYIENKRKTMSPTGDSEAAGAEPENETSTLAREFFSSFMALKQEGTLNTNAVDNISSSIAMKVGDTDLPDTYLSNQIKVVDSNKKNLLKYQSDLEKLFNKYKTANLGNELAIMGDAMQNDEPGDTAELATIANTYRTLAKEMSKIPTPKNVAKDHLGLVNSYEKTGTAVEKMSDVLENPIVATTGTIMYARYIKEIEGIVESIKTTFIDNGILEKDAN